MQTLILKRYEKLCVFCMKIKMHFLGFSDSFSYNLNSVHLISKIEFNVSHQHIHTYILYIHLAIIERIIVSTQHLFPKCKPKLEVFFYRKGAFWNLSGRLTISFYISFCSKMVIFKNGK